MFIIVTNLGLLVGFGAQVGNSGGLFIGQPEDSFNVSVQLPPAANTSIRTACHASLHSSIISKCHQFCLLAIHIYRYLMYCIHIPYLSCFLASSVHIPSPINITEMLTIFSFFKLILAWVFFLSLFYISLQNYKISHSVLSFTPVPTSVVIYLSFHLLLFSLFMHVLQFTILSLLTSNKREISELHCSSSPSVRYMGSGILDSR
jgi:hypothetical protein